MTEITDRIARADQAEMALAQFLRPAFDVMRAEYTHALSIVGAKPMSIETQSAIINLSVALKALGELQAQIESLVVDGKVAGADLERTQRMSHLTTEAARWARY